MSRMMSPQSRRRNRVVMKIECSKGLIGTVVTAGAVHKESEMTNVTFPVFSAFLLRSVKSASRLVAGRDRVNRGSQQFCRIPTS